MAVKNFKLTLKSLQVEVNALREELKSIKDELIDAKEEIKELKMEKHPGRTGQNQMAKSIPEGGSEKEFGCKTCEKKFNSKKLEGQQ